MTRNERVMTGLVLVRFPEIDPETALHWIYTRNGEFEGLSPADFEQKYGGKRFKKRIASLKKF